MRRFLSGALALSLTVLGVGCDGNSKSCTKFEPNSVIVALFDISQSTRHRGIRERYVAAFKTLVPTVRRDGGVLAADIIDDNPLAHSELPINRRFSMKKSFNPVMGKKLEFEDCLRRKNEESARLAQSTVETARQIISQNPQPGTRIMDALRLSGRVFSTYEGSRQKYLVVFSDMIEIGGRYPGGFTRRSLKPKRIARFIARELATGRLPDLIDVEVYVVGAGVESSGKTNPELTFAIEKFWLRYFKAAGADLSTERYGPTLIRFP